MQTTGPEDSRGYFLARHLFFYWLPRSYFCATKDFNGCTNKYARIKLCVRSGQRLVIRIITGISIIGTTGTSGQTRGPHF